jgi:hypothetical protein
MVHHIFIGSSTMNVSIYSENRRGIYFSLQKRLKHGRQNITLHWINGIIRNNKCIFTKLNQADDEQAKVTPLNIAGRSGHIECVKLILDHCEGLYHGRGRFSGKDAHINMACQLDSPFAFVSNDRQYEYNTWPRFIPPNKELKSGHKRNKMSRHSGFASFNAAPTALFSSSSVAYCEICQISCPILLRA